MAHSCSATASGISSAFGTKYGLGKLPVEIIVEILAHLDFRSLLKCRETCWMLHTLIDSSTRFQYKIQLGAFSQDDGPPSAVSSATRWKMLHDYDDAWNTLTWSESIEIPNADGGLWELYGNVIAQFESDGAIQFMQLPSRSRGIPQRTWRVENIKFDVADFSMDPAQDLLVLIEEPPSGAAADFPLRIHLLTMSTGESHPLAASPAILEHKGHFESPFADAAYNVQISGSYIGVHETIEDDILNRLIIQDWRTGRIMMILITDWKALDLRGFAFLDDRYVLAAVLGHNPSSGALQIYDFKASQDSCPESPTACCTLHLPDHSEKASPWEMKISSNPAPGWEPHADVQSPFFCSQHARVYVVTLFVDYALEESRGFDFFVPSTTLLPIIENVTRNQPSESSCVLWKDWGPTGACMLPSSRAPDDVWGCFVHGMKFVDLDQNSGIGGFEMLDFRPFSIQRGPRDTNITREAIITSSKVTFPDVFVNDIVTMLPFRLIRRPFDNLPNAVMCTEDALVLVDNGEGLHGEGFRILIF